MTVFTQQAAKTNHSILPFLSKKLNHLKRKNNKNILNAFMFYF